MTNPTTLGFEGLLPLISIIVIVGFVPFLAVVTTAFSKITIVLMILRNAIGVQQTPPNIVVFAIAMVLTLNVMQPVFNTAMQSFPTQDMASLSIPALAQAGREAAEPLRDFMLANSEPTSRQFFLDAARKRARGTVSDRDFGVAIPAFLLDEITKAFDLGFLIYIPFIVIDFVTGIILIALGLQTMSATAIATPFKILLFIQAHGWERLMDMLLSSYR